MKVQSINVNVGRKILNDQNETHSIEIGLQVSLEPDEDEESVYYSLKNTLEGQLDTWEHEVRTNQQPRVITIPEMDDHEAPPLVTASNMKPKVIKPKKEPPREKKVQKEPQEQQIQTTNEIFICPTCGEQMQPKEGKDYYLCTKHWGYPDMIRKGLVKERKF